VGQISEERGLTRARLTAEHDGSALTGANVGQELVKRRALRLPPQESYGTVSPMQEAVPSAQPYTCLLRRVPAARRYQGLTLVRRPCPTAKFAAAWVGNPSSTVRRSW
jgi:hypothetical protein